MKYFNTTLLIIVFSLLILSACKKEPGIGGDASIRGNIFVKHYNTTFTQFISQYEGADIYVYLVYGNNVDYGTRIKSNYNGDFEFKYLYKGNYKVYVYSLDSTLQEPSGRVPVIKEIEITERKQVMDLDTIKIFN